MTHSNTNQKKTQPNIIYILGDDHRADVLSHMGHPIVETPNLDQLASKGFSFSNAFCTSPTCTPSRACHYLGQWERTHGINFNSGTSVSPEEWNNSWPMRLKDNGYFLGWVGKNHVPVGLGGYESGHMEQCFDYWYGNHHHSMFYPKEGPNGHIYSNADADTQIEIFEQGVSNFLNPQSEFIENCETPLSYRPTDMPFCLCVTFNLPHGAGTGNMQLRPSDSELYKSKYRDRFNDFELPPTYASAYAGMNKIPKEVYNGIRIPQYDYVKDPVFLRERMVRVCQTVTGIDRMVGNLCMQLEELGIADNTIIIFSTDHGIHWGEHGLGGKCFLYEEDIKIPLVIYDPRLPESVTGRCIDEMIVVPDLGPTILDLLSIDGSSSMQGISFKKLLENKPCHWRTSFFAEQLLDKQNYPKSECLRTESWKYIRYFGRTEDPAQESKLYRSTLDDYKAFLSQSFDKNVVYEELYDLQNDPHEEINLAETEEYYDQLSKMRQELQSMGRQILNHPEAHNSI